MTQRRLYARAPQQTAPLVYASEAQIAVLIGRSGCASSPAYKLARLRERPITRERVERDLLATTRRLP